MRPKQEIILTEVIDIEGSAELFSIEDWTVFTQSRPRLTFSDAKKQILAGQHGGLDAPPDDPLWNDKDYVHAHYGMTQDHPFRLSYNGYHSKSLFFETKEGALETLELMKACQPLTWDDFYSFIWWM